MSVQESSVRQLLWGLTARQVSILLTVLALVIWSYSITQAEFEIGKYGLIHSFPPSFFISLGILTVASAILWVSGEHHQRLLFLQLFFLIVSLFLAPVIVGGAQPVLSFVYSAEGPIDYIVRHGHIADAPSYALWAQNWPGGPIFWATATNMAGTNTVNSMGFLQYLPLIWQMVFLFLVFIFLKKVGGTYGGPNCIWAGLWLFSLGNWLGQQNNNPQALGLLCLLAVIVMLPLARPWNEWSDRFGNRLSAIGITAFVAITHFLSSVALLSITAMLYMMRRIRRFSLVAIAVTVIAAWAMYGADYYLRWKLAVGWEQLFGVGSTVESNIATPLFGDPSHAAVSTVRLALSAIIVLMAIAGILLGRRLGGSSRADIAILGIMGGYALVALVFAANYGSEGLLRIFLYTLPFLAYFALKLLYRRVTAVVFVALLLLLLPMTFVSMHGNQEIDYLSPGYLSAVESFHNNSYRGHVVGVQPIGTIRNVEGYTFAKHENLEWRPNGELENVGEFTDTTPDYICIADYDQTYYAFLKDRPDLVVDTGRLLQTASNCNLVFANPSFKLYESQRSGF